MRGERIARDAGLTQHRLDVREQLAGGGGVDVPAAFGEHAVAVHDGDGCVVGCGVDAELGHVVTRITRRGGGQVRGGELRVLPRNNVYSRRPSRFP